MIFAVAAFIHPSWAWWPIIKFIPWRDSSRLMAGFIVPFSVSAYLLLDVTTSLASRLTAWEAAYRGLRLPRPVVERALQYHSAHYLPVALFTFITIAGYQYLIQYRPSIAFDYPMHYLYLLCAEVILAAGYLFITYWTGMKNLMFANSGGA